MTGVEIVAGEGESESKDFKAEVRRMLDPRKHPFWEFSERILILARRGSKRSYRSSRLPFVPRNRGDL